MRDSRKLAVVIPCYNKVYYTQKTIQSLIECTHADLHIILVDDNSTDETWQYHTELGALLNKEAQHLFYHKNDTNMGVTSTWNTGLSIALATGIEYICIANNDLLFTDGWDIPLLDALGQDYWLVSPYSTEGIHNPVDWPAGSTRHPNPMGIGILGANFMFKPKLIAEIGMFPTCLKHYYNDNWIVDTCRGMGLKFGHIQASYIHHLQCMTTKDLGSAWFHEDGAAYKKYNEERSQKTGKEKLFTIGYRQRFPEVYKKYLGESIGNLVGEFDVIGIGNTQISDSSDFRSKKYPAENYNEIIDKATTPYVLLVHEDIVFTPDILDSLEATINEHPDFGAIGLVGPHSDGVNRWSEEGKSWPVESLDSCCILIRKDLGVKFNSEVFDELHCYVEAICGEIRALGKEIYTINYKPGAKMDHCSTTWNKLGGSWGNYNRYREILSKMYPGLKTT